MITAFSLILALVTFITIVQGLFYCAIFFLLLNRLCDGLDGRLAQHLGPTNFGAYFDILADFIFYGLIPLAFVVLNSNENGLAGSFLLFSFLVSGTSFMMFAVLGQAEKLSSIWGEKKGFYFAAGIIEGTETIIFFLLLCLLPQYFTLLSFGFGTLCWVSVAARLLAAYKI